MNTLYKGDKDDDDNSNNNNDNCKEVRVVLKLDWYDHVPNLAETSREGKVTILWIQQVLIDRNIPDKETGHHNP